MEGAETLPSERVVLGFDPGARNLGVASSDDAFLSPTTIDLGPLDYTSDAQVLRTLHDSLHLLLLDERIDRVQCEAQLIFVTDDPKRPKVTARLHQVQGALAAMAMSAGKPFELVSAIRIKHHYWSGLWTKRTYEQNKQASIDKCVELYGAHYGRYSDHACDAKLIACYKR